MSDIFIEIVKGIATILLYSWWIIALILAWSAWQNRRKARWVKGKESVLLEIKIPKTNDKNPTAAEMMFAALHGILKPKKDMIFEGSIQEHVGFEIVADINSIRFFVWTPKHLRDFVEGQVYAQYPLAEITETDDYVKKLSVSNGPKEAISGSHLVLMKEDYLPIKTFNNFQVDPLAGITGALAKLEEKDEEIWIQILARPVTDEWKRKGLDWINQKKNGGITLPTEKWYKWLLAAPFKILGETLKLLTSGPSEKSEIKMSTEEEGRVAAIKEKSEKMGYLVKIRIGYVSPSQTKAREKVQSVFGAFQQYNTTNLNGFKGKRISNSRQFLNDYQNRIFLDKGAFGQSFHLNIEELASVYHLPHTSVETPNIKWTSSKTAESPTDLPTEINTDPAELALFAETNFRNHHAAFGLKRDDRRRHVYIIGKSGLGKTKLMENLINSDLAKGEGFAVMDPHGDLSKDTIRKIPDDRIKDVILFNPADTEFPIAFNPMEVIDDNLKVQIAAGVVGTFKKIFGQSWGPRLEYVLNYTVLALLDTPGSTLLGIVSMLTDKDYRKKIIANIKDPVVKKFWTTEFASYNEKFATEAVAPILNKVGQFVANSLIRNVIGQPKSSFSIRQAMDERKIILINLSVGLVGETNASLLGSLMVTAIQLAAMSRANVEEEQRNDFYLYVDEFQNFATDSFKNILSEARKYRLSLTMANQYIAQLEDTGVKDAVFGNVGTMISFRVGAQDASAIEKEFNPPFESRDLINLERQHIYIKMTIDGKASDAFSAKVLTVTQAEEDNIQKIVEHSRSLYTKSRVEVEEIISSGMDVVAINLPKTDLKSGETSTDAAPGEQESTTSESDEEEFEAPIVKNIGKKGKGGSTNKEETKNKLNEIIKESTAHLSEKKKDEPQENASGKPANQKTEEKGSDKVDTTPAENTHKEEPKKIKDKIDKETLSAILKTVVTPNEVQGDKIENKTGDSSSAKAPEQDKKIINKEVVQEEQPLPAPNEKIITPKNFKDIKEIHPHEIVKVSSDSSLKDVKEGEKIKF